MTKKWTSVLTCLALLGGGTSAVFAGSGLASYDRHTSEMVTAARHEPIGSILKVRNPQNGRTVMVRVNDRGPFNGNRVLDLSTGAFSAIYGGLGRGVGPVDYVVVSRGGSPRLRRTHGSWHHWHHHHHRRWHHWQH